MFLIIDVGNTRVKLGIYSKKKLKILYFDTVNSFLKYLNNLKKNKIHFKASVISSVIKNTNLLKIEKLLRFVSSSVDSVKKLAQPFLKSKYNFNMLGDDRVAAIAYAFFKKYLPCVIVDAGSAITIDYIIGPNIFMGGYICSGLQMEYNALYNNTANLPHVIKKKSKVFIPLNTNDAILNGVREVKIRGIKALIDNDLSKIKVEREKWRIILSGGDAELFKKNVRNAEIHENIVLKGLLELLKNKYEIK